jgi:hypothetical protein
MRRLRDETAVSCHLPPGTEAVSYDLYDALEYSEFDELIRWWPLGKGQRVVIDPRRSSGRPIVLEGVQTNILASSFHSAGDVRAVASWYEVSEPSVSDALEFERSLTAA